MHPHLKASSPGPHTHFTHRHTRNSTSCQATTMAQANIGPDCEKTGEALQYLATKVPKISNVAPIRTTRPDIKSLLKFYRGQIPNHIHGGRSVSQRFDSIEIYLKVSCISILLPSSQFSLKLIYVFSQAQKLLDPRPQLLMLRRG